MSAEQRRILEMLADGKITSSEADALLQALGMDEGEEGAVQIDEDIRVEEGGKNRQRPFADLTPDQLMEMSLHGGNAVYVRQMRDLGLGDLSPEQLVEMKIHGARVCKGNACARV